VADLYKRVDSPLNDNIEFAPAEPGRDFPAPSENWGRLRDKLNEIGIGHTNYSTSAGALEAINILIEQRNAAVADKARAEREPSSTVWTTSDHQQLMIALRSHGTSVSGSTSLIDLIVGTMQRLADDARRAEQEADATNQTVAELQSEVDSLRARVVLYENSNSAPAGTFGTLKAVMERNNLDCDFGISITQTVCNWLDTLVGERDRLNTEAKRLTDKRAQDHKNLRIAVEGINKRVPSSYFSVVNYVVDLLGKMNIELVNAKRDRDAAATELTELRTRITSWIETGE
jgi:chromosome segregation ATPase